MYLWEEWFNLVKKGVFTLQTCKDCSVQQFYPRSFCVVCNEDNLELEKIVTKIVKDEKIFYKLKSQSEDRTIPNFLIENDFSANDEDLVQGIKLVSDFLEKSILKPNNLNQPLSRSQFLSNLE